MPKSKKTKRREAIARMQKRIEFWNELITATTTKAVLHYRFENRDFSQRDIGALAAGVKPAALAARKIAALAMTISKTEVKY